MFRNFGFYIKRIPIAGAKCFCIETHYEVILNNNKHTHVVLSENRFNANANKKFMIKSDINVNKRTIEYQFNIDIQYSLRGIKFAIKITNLTDIDTVPIEKSFDYSNDDIQFINANPLLLTKMGVVDDNDYYMKGKEAGFKEGYTSGKNDGYDFGYDNGYTEGHEEGCNEGYEQGCDEGYEQGCIEGWDKGYVQGCNDAYYNGCNQGFANGYFHIQPEIYNQGFSNGYDQCLIDYDESNNFDYVEETPIVIEETPIAIEETPIAIEETPIVVIEETPIVVIEETPVVIEETPVVIEEEPIVSRHNQRDAHKNILSGPMGNLAKMIFSFYQRANNGKFTFRRIIRHYFDIKIFVNGFIHEATNANIKVTKDNILFEDGELLIHFNKMN
jgi:hypothetical protein